MKPSAVASRLALARRVALEAGRLQLRELRRLKPGDVRSKSRNNFVTHVDLASEKIILSAVHRAFPEDAVLSEEAGERSGTGAAWIVDPLDGTSNYIRRIPFFGVSIAIALEGRVRAGVLHVPCRGETFWAQENKGAFLNGRRIRVSDRARPDESLIGTAIPYKSLHRRWKEYDSILRRISRAGADIRRSGAMAVDLAYVACGRLDALWAFDQAPWDLAAGELLVREAGGVAAGLRSGKIGGEADRLAGNPALYRRLRTLISR